jgi:hypothetical protein
MHHTTWAQYSQQITAAEFFWGTTDPGPGNGTAIAAADGNYSDAIEQAFRSGNTVPNVGLNVLNVRFKGNNSTWGVLFRSVVNVESLSAFDIKVTQAEYFIDTDNGAGNNIALLAFDGNFNNAIETAVRNNIIAPALGLHTLGVRMLGNDGTWGSVFTAVFNVDALFTADFKITSGEYFFDTDPGEGSAIPLIAFDGNYSNAIEQTLNTGVSALPLGLHTLNVRFRGLDGIWGSVFKSIVNTDALFTADFKIIQAEYFFDTDPGEGNGTPMVALDGSFNNAIETAISSAATGALAVGNHVLSVRMKGLDNLWGAVYSVVVVVDPCTPAPSANITAGGPVTFCPGDSVTLNANTGSGLTYQWRKDGVNIPGDTTSSFKARQSGVYDVAVRNTGGCTTISNAITVTVAGSASPVVTIVAAPGNLICPNTNVTFTATPTNGGTTPAYQWQLNGNNVGLNQATYSNSSLNSNDVVRVIMTSNAACVFPLADTSNTITVQFLAAPSATVTPSAPTTFCSGSSINLSAAAGNTYVWSTGATTQSITVSTANTFRVTVTNANNCTVVSSPITTTVNANPTATITPGGPTTFCQGNNVSLTAGGGVSYVWSTTATITTISATVSGNYTVTVTNTNGCTASATQSVTVNNAPNMVITPNGSTTICQGNSVGLTASGANTYVWSTTATTATINVSVSGPYAVTGTSSTGCTASASQSILVNTNPTASIAPSGPTTFCTGGSVTLTASGGGTYSWSTGVTTSAILVTTSGTYVVTVTNANGCTASALQVVTVNSNNTATITPSGPTTFCQGGSVTLTAGTGTAYSWSTGVTTATITVNASGTYTVTVTSGVGCSATASQSVTVNTLPIAAILPATVAICNGASTTLTASGGTSYVWSNSGGTNAQATFSPTSNTTYTVTVTNVNGCSATASRLLTVNALPTATISANGSVVFCQGSNVTLTASGGGTYLWSTTATTTAVTVNANGNYTVTVTNANGCSASASQIVTVNSLPNAQVSPAVSAICTGQSTTLTASGGNSYSWSTNQTTNSIAVSPTSNTVYTVTVTNANNCSATATATINVNSSLTPLITPASPSICLGESITLTTTVGTSYSWSNSTTQQSITVSPAVNTNYSVTVTNGSGCSGTASVTVIVNPLPAVPVITPNGATSFCSGGSVTLEGSAANVYNWSNGLTTQSIIVNSSGNYILTITDANNCSRASLPIIVTVFNNPVAAIAPATATICNGESITLTASGGATYSWSNGLGSGVTKNVSPTANEAYVVTVTDANNCSATATKNVTVNQPSAFSFNAVVCSNSPYVFNSQNLSVTGIYFDTLTNVLGCDSIVTLNLSVNSTSSTTLNESICAGSNFVFDNQSLTASGIYYDTLTNAVGCDSAVVLNLSVVTALNTTIDTNICQGEFYLFDGSNLDIAGTYFDTLISASGCDSIVMLNLNVSSLPTVSFSLNIETLCTNAGTLNLSGGLPAGGDYNGTGINNNNLDPSALPDGDLIISYLFEDTNGCSNSALDTLFIETCIGIKNKASKNIDVNLFPNPASNYLIVSSELFTDPRTTIMVHDVAGKAINLTMNQTIATERIINTESIAIGIYWVTVKNENYTTVKRFVKIN